VPSMVVRPRPPAIDPITDPDSGRRISMATVYRAAARAGPAARPL
jgi:hypothetical protein